MAEEAPAACGLDGLTGRLGLAAGADLLSSYSRTGAATSCS